MEMYTVMHSHEQKTTNLQPCQMCVLDLDSSPLLRPDDGLLSSGSMGKSEADGKFHRNGDSLISSGRGLLSVVNRVDDEVPESLGSGGSRASELQSGGPLGNVASRDEGEGG